MHILKIKFQFLTELQSCDLIDLCIVIDSSGSIRDNNPADKSYDNWELILAFVQQVTNVTDLE